MSVAQVVATLPGENTGTTAVPLALPSGIANGQLLLAWVQVANAAQDFTDDASKGWWRYVDQIFNSRETFLFARIYNAADPASVYNLTLTAGTAVGWMTAAVKDHGVTKQSDVLVGTVFTRSASNGVVTMPSITTPGIEYLALGLTGEATTTAADYAVTTDAGFTLAGRRVNATVIEDLTLWRKDMPTAGATGTQSLTYTAAALNGVGVQIGIPPATATVAPATGQIGMRGASGMFTDRLSIGIKKLAGTTVTAILQNAGGTAELGRVVVPTDATSGWGNAQFPGLTPGTTYRVRFDVDGTLQTDAILTYRTQRTGQASFKYVAGSCQFTNSNHPVWDRIREEDPDGLAHMGDIAYPDTSVPSVWRAAIESSFNATKFRALLDLVPMNWVADNHDRIITNPTGAGTGLNLGETDPLTVSEWKKFSGDVGWGTPDTLARTWTNGRVRFIQTDGWAVRDDADGDPNPRTFLGAAQKQWWKDTLAAATEPLIVWFTQWTTRANANGRWNSFPEETTELENFINARPGLKRRMVLVGGDSHSIQADSGHPSNTLRAAGTALFRFKGMPSLNISGFNRSDVAGDGSPAGEWNIANTSLRTSAQLEADWGGYSRMRFTDRGVGGIDLKWQGIKVDAAGGTEIVGTFEGTFGATQPRAMFFDGIMERPIMVHRVPVLGTEYQVTPTRAT